MNARTELPLGLVYGMPNEDYHALKALGSSGIKKLARSPRHFFGTTLDPQRPADEPTAAMKAGTLAHCAVLEPAELGQRYQARPPGMDLRTTAGKAWAASVPAGLEAVTFEQMQTAKHQARAVRALPEIASLLSVGEPEVSAFWMDEETGVHCKCRPDWVSPAGSGVILVDLKTTKDASPEGFPKSMANFGYHLQAAWYTDGFERASGKQVLGFVFAAVESDWPHAAAAYMLDDEVLGKARAEVRRLLQLYDACMSSGEWPGYPNTIQPITLPKWAL